MTTLRLLIFAAVSIGAGFGIGLAVLFWRGLRSCRVDWTGLIVDEATGKASHSKLGVHGFNLAAIVLLLRVCWNASPGEGVATMLFAVGGLLGAQQVASKAIGAKVFGGGAAATPGVSTTSRTETVEERKTVALPAPVANPAAPSTESRT